MVGARILVGVDGSPEARDAAVLGRKVATATHGVLRLATATADVIADVALTRFGLDADRLHEALLERARATIEENLRGLFDPTELKTILTARIGRPEQVLSECGQEMDADLFVIGGRRHEHPAPWFRRGTAHHLLRVCDHPILITGPQGPEVDRVLVAVDSSFAARRAIQVGGELAELLGVSLEALHVVSVPEVPAQWGLGADLGRAVGEQEDEVRREIWPLLPDGTHRNILRGDTVATIRQALEGTSPTLLVLGSHGRGWIHRLLLGSTTEAFLAELPCSLAVVPAKPLSVP